jgi:hypothetical protein
MGFAWMLLVIQGFATLAISVMALFLALASTQAQPVLSRYPFVYTYRSCSLTKMPD